LWSGLRRGEDMTCHPTDPDNPVEAEWLAKGVKRAPDGATTTECTGALILKQREWMRLQACVERRGDDPAAAKAGWADYRAAHPRGLTRDGIACFMSRVLFSGTLLASGPDVARPNLNEDGIAAPGIVAWTPGETT
jgi:hypothetical protein